MSGSGNYLQSMCTEVDNVSISKQCADGRNGEWQIAMQESLHLKGSCLIGLNLIVVKTGEYVESVCNVLCTEDVVEVSVCVKLMS